MRTPLAREKNATRLHIGDSNVVGKRLKAMAAAAVVAASLATGMVANAHAESPGAASTPAAAPATVKPAAVTPAEARAILMRMADFMAKAKSFTVDVRGSYDVYQKSGQKIEFGQVRKITLLRPDRLRVDAEDSSGDRTQVIFDGKEISVASPMKNVYAQAPKSGTVDDAIVYFVRDLGMKLPLAVLMLTTAPDELAQRTLTLEYVEKTSILGAPAHHLAGRTDTVDYQIWVADGDRPLPLRVVLTYPKEKGQPQYRAAFSDWNLTPEIPASTFAFTPPAGAQKIAFLAQLPRMSSKGIKGGKSKKSGGKK